MKIYNYDATTGELLGESEARPDPMEPGRWLVPAYATTVTPPEAQAGQMRCFDGTAWVFVAIE